MSEINLTTQSAMKQTSFAQDQVAKLLYLKGRDFLRASVLLQENGGNRYVVLHLFCQGYEIILKSFLLFKDYEQYKPLLKSRFGHKLVKLTEEVVNQFSLNPLRDNLKNELQELDFLYSKHLLRYDSAFDILINPSTIEDNLVISRLLAAIRLAGLYIR